MKPPICCICDKDLLSDKGGLVHSKKSPEDLQWDKKMEQDDFVGHPPYAAWFCENHYDVAVKYKHKTYKEAVTQIKLSTNYS